MTAKEQKLDKNEKSLHIAKLYRLLTISEDLHEITGISPTTDLEFVYTKDIPDDVDNSIVRIGSGKFQYQVLYDKIAEEYIEFLEDVMLPYANRTMSNEIEFMNILLNTGEYLILEGDEDKVSLPIPEGIGVAHTHPGICLFSYKDIETADNTFIKGYVINSVLNPKCISSIFRKGVYTLDDRENLLQLSKSVKKAKTLDSLVGAYKRFSSENLVFKYKNI
jgi:hypothetical protein